VSSLSFKTFISALNGEPITISKQNHNDLRLFCEEFGFESLVSKLSTIEGSASFEELNLSGEDCET
jgi:hypothetical protein